MAIKETVIVGAVMLDGVQQGISQAIEGEAMERTASQGLRAESRRLKILEWIEQEGAVRVRTLANSFGVSAVTVRQDLEKLEAEGHIAREHGGAFKSLTQHMPPMAPEHRVNMDVKRRIGRAAAELVSDGETVILDCGSTVSEVAVNLVDRKGLTVVTNSLNIALRLGGLPTFDVHMPGGSFNTATLSLSGERSIDYFQGLFAQKLFLATHALSIEAGLTYPAMHYISVKRAMIASSREVILVTDSSKFGKRSFSSLGGIDLVQVLVTDDGIRDEDRTAFDKLGIKVILA